MDEDLRHPAVRAPTLDARSPDDHRPPADQRAGARDGSAPSRSALARWIAEHRAACDMEVRAIPWRESREWAFDGTALRHRAGAFFSVVGASVVRAGRRLRGFDQPLIDQPEVGILGFLFRRTGDGVEVLVQAKAEPGNVGLVQAGPTVQATESNYRRRHGGRATPLLERFVEPAPGSVVADGLQSEQGSRFLGKFNRNVCALVAAEDALAGGGAPGSDALRWFPVGELRALLLEDFGVNTDARSVLACAPWDLVAGGRRAFSRAGDDLTAELHRSRECADADADRPVAEIPARLEGLRGTADFRTEVVPLPDLAGWETTDDAIRPADGRRAFEVRAFAVRTTQREVERWDQPLAASREATEIVLLAQVRRGVLHLLFRARPEPGFREAYQLGPTLQDDGGAAALLPGWAGHDEALRAAAARGRVLVSNLQSDEGGRFHRSVARYAVVLAAGKEDVGRDPWSSWLTLAQTEALLRRRGVFTNEARSAISLLLALA